MERLDLGRCRHALACALMLASLLAQTFGQAIKPVRAKSAMVASQHALASAIGCDIMRKGGNAVDAAIAVGIALAVVYPEAGNIGGGGFMLIRTASGGVHAIDYREAAPKAATSAMYVDPEGQLIKGQGSSTLGYRAAGVPGTLAGFELAFNKYGSKKVPWADLVHPARVLAERGFELSYRQSDLLRDNAEKLAEFDEAKRIFLRGSELYQHGETLRQPDLAATLARVEKFGAKELYTGKTAELIAEDMRAHGGLITREDLRAYGAKEREPLRGSYRGYEVITVPPPSAGGIVALETLNILEGFDIKGLGSNSAARFHLTVEAMRRSTRDRAEFLGDPDFVAVPTRRLTDKAYARQRRRDIDLKAASQSKETMPGRASEGTETTHFSVVDPDGMVVSNTYTLNDYFGSKVVAKGTGILLNDEMDDFTSQPGKPNLYGLVQSGQNKIEGGKRPSSSMTPTIVLRKNGTPWFAVGARGGSRIPSAVLQAVMNVIDFDMDIQSAINAPRVHHQWLPDELVYEPDSMSSDTLNILSSYGHHLINEPSYIASMTGVMIGDNGERLGAVDRRSDGQAVGY